jgi:hypothetical protein
MKTIEIVADPSSLQRSGMGSITGQVFLRGPSGSFPEEGWSDFPVVILGWWINGLRRLGQRKRASYQGLFMDGPYAFVVQCGFGEADEILWGEIGSEAPVGIVDVALLLASAVAAAKSVTIACRAKGWNTPDVESLESAIESGAA